MILSEEINIVTNYDDEVTAHEVITKEKWIACNSIQSCRYNHSLECHKIQLKQNTITNLFSLSLEMGMKHDHSSTTVECFINSVVYGIDESLKALIQEYERLRSQTSGVAYP